MVSSACSSRRARRSGVGRQIRRASWTGSGMSMYRSCETSCLISSIGKSGARSCGPMGCLVPGCSAGIGGNGRSAWMLYQRVGISCWSSRNRVAAGALMLMTLPPSLVGL